MISLTRGKCAIVDDADFDELSKHKWYARYGRSGFYARRAIYDTNLKQEIISMHRLIANAPKGMVVDHINHDTLDNRRANLRVCTSRQNSLNKAGPNKNSTTGIRGVFESEYGYISKIGVNGKSVYLGLFKCPIEAGKAYAEANKKYFGTFGGK